MARGDPDVARRAKSGASGQFRLALPQMPRVETRGALLGGGDTGEPSIPTKLIGALRRLVGPARGANRGLPAPLVFLL
jgi:hypothetical protein